MKYSKSYFHTAIFLAILLTLAISTEAAFAHEDGAPFSGAIIEPLDVHHAHIEDEQRINLIHIDGLREKSGTKRTALYGSMELAVDWTGGFRVGSEIFIPFSNKGLDKNHYGIGDMVVWPVKYAFINEPETIFTGALTLVLPTGSESRGLGKGNTTLGVAALFDHAWRNWYWGLNTEISTNVSGGSSTEVEFASVVSYSFIRGTGAGMAASRPNQSFVPALSMEIISESVLRGADEGENVVKMLPGFHLWHTGSGWQARVGVEVPISLDKEDDFSVLFQVSNHFNWRGSSK